MSVVCWGNKLKHRFRKVEDNKPQPKVSFVQRMGQAANERRTHLSVINFIVALDSKINQVCERFHKDSLTLTGTDLACLRYFFANPGPIPTEQDERTMALAIAKILVHPKDSTKKASMDRAIDTILNMKDFRLITQYQTALTEGMGQIPCPEEMSVAITDKVIENLQRNCSSVRR